jgi:hypothetical protein
MRRRIPLLLLATISCCCSATADQISDELKLAITKYQSKDVAGAIESVQLAETWLMEKQASDVTGVFGDLPGWKRELGEGGSAGSAFLGGGVTAACEYVKGEGRMEATIVGNSPMLAMVGGMVGNAMMAAASGAKIVKVHGQRAAIQKEGDDWQLLLPYESKALVTVNTNTSREDLLACAEALDWQRLRAIFDTQ